MEGTTQMWKKQKSVLKYGFLHEKIKRIGRLIKLTEIAGIPPLVKKQFDNYRESCICYPASNSIAISSYYNFRLEPSYLQYGFLNTHKKHLTDLYIF